MLKQIFIGLIQTTMIWWFQGCLFGEDSNKTKLCEDNAFVVTFPNAGDSLVTDSVYKLKWKSCGSEADKIDIVLYSGGDSVLKIADNIKNDGGHSWTIPKYQRPGQRYAIKITSAKNKEKSTLSADFSIAKKFVEPCANGEDYFISRPNSASEVMLSTYMQVEWEPCSGSWEKATIELFKGDTLIKYSGISVSHKGKFNYFISSRIPKGGNYRVKISKTGQPDLSAFSEPFSISSPYHGAISVTQPPGGDTLIMGDSIEVKWNTKGEIGDSILIHLLDKESIVRYPPINGKNDGVEKIKLSGRALSGSQFRIKVLSGSDESVFSLSETFTILPFVFPSPKSSDTLIAGSNFTIKWQGAVVGGYSLMLCKGESVIADIVTYWSEPSWKPPDQNSPNGTFYYSPHINRHKWKLPTTLFDGSGYRFLIEDANPEIKAYSDSFTVKNPFADDYEPDNSMASAQPISANGTAQIHNLAYGESDWMTFVPKKNWVYEICLFSEKEKKFYLHELENKKYWLCGEDCYSEILRGINENDDDLKEFSNEMLEDFNRQFEIVFSEAIKNSNGYHATVLFRKTDTNALFLRVVSGNYADTGMYRVQVKGYDPARHLVIKNPDFEAEWESGAEYDLRWEPDSALFAGEVSFQLVHDGEYIYKFVYKTANDGQHKITMPKGLATDDAYHIEMISPSNPEVIGHSKPFKITGIAHVK